MSDMVTIAVRGPAALAVGTLAIVGALAVAARAARVARALWEARKARGRGPRARLTRVLIPAL